ncbi:MAG: hypothetical protein MRJ92_17235 [Nitrospira sp.]|nr:hypothetical protein [Nitrospira sp.]
MVRYDGGRKTRSDADYSKSVLTTLALAEARAISWGLRGVEDSRILAA